MMAAKGLSPPKVEFPGSQGKGKERQVQDKGKKGGTIRRVAAG